MRVGVWHDQKSGQNPVEVAPHARGGLGRQIARRQAAGGSPTCAWGFGSITRIMRLSHMRMWAWFTHGKLSYICVEVWILH